jgi:hypothetical protein
MAAASPILGNIIAIVSIDRALDFQVLEHELAA